MNFNEALDKAKTIAADSAKTMNADVFLVRDLFGRIRLLLEHPPKGEVQKQNVKTLLDELHQTVGNIYAYPRDELVMYREDLSHAKLPDSAQAMKLDDRVYLIDRLLMGGLWNVGAPPEHKKPQRFTLFSMKGGVGRSTTAAMLAYHLAQQGKHVLVLDLDLESPGIGTTLLGSQLPRFGVVDWFVEDVLGQGKWVVSAMTGVSALGENTQGSIRVVPCYGTETGDYLPKLGRSYLELGAKGPKRWPERITELVKALEKIHKPDIVLLDSRTGLHDTSAALVLAMGANTLMFAVDTRQTWEAYRFLFSHWKQHPDVARFRERLWMVGSMVPDANRESYLMRLQQNAYELFNTTLYEPEGEAKQGARFSAKWNDDAAGHYPRPIRWHQMLMAFDPLTSADDAMVQASYREFLDWFDDVLMGRKEGEQ